MFNPKTSIEAEKAKGEGGAGIDIEEVRHEGERLLLNL